VKLTGFAISQVWHERTDESPAHQWLRSVISEVSALA